LMRQALHAYALTLEHPVSKEVVTWFQVPPEDLIELLPHLSLSTEDLPKKDALLVSIVNERR